MIANFKLSIEDFNKLIDFEIVKILEKSKMSYVNLVLLCASYALLITALCLLVAVLFDAEGDTVSKTAVSYALLPLLAAWILAKIQEVLVERIMRRNFCDRDGPYLGAQSLEIKDRSLIWKTDRITMEVDIRALKAIEVDDRYVYILFDHSAGIPLPLSAFKSDEDKRQFLQRLSKLSTVPLTGAPEQTGPWGGYGPAESPSS